MSITYFKCFLESWVYKKKNYDALLNSSVFVIMIALVFIFTYMCILHFTLIKENATT